MVVTYHEGFMISRAPVLERSKTSSFNPTRARLHAWEASVESLIGIARKLAISLPKQIRFVTPQLPRYT
jgi:hypothetical protein